jgi:hypothetical protein
MSNRAGDPQQRQHNLSDWLALHELDPITCRRILDAMVLETVARAGGNNSEGYNVIAPEVAWQEAVQAMSDFLPEWRGIIGDTFEHSVRVAVEVPDKPRRSLTVDNGSGAYPTILFGYRGEPIDALVIAHEFAHAVQIMASQGRLVPPIIRETCAFLGEGALLSQARRRDQSQYSHLVHAWQEANQRYFGPQKERLRAALSKPHAPYSYAWNYPIARYLAIQISDRCSRNCIWSLFQGKSSVNELLRELGVHPS